MSSAIEVAAGCMPIWSDMRGANHRFLGQGHGAAAQEGSAATPAAAVSPAQFFLAQFCLAQSCMRFRNMSIPSVLARVWD